MPFAVPPGRWPESLNVLGEHGVDLLALTPAGRTDLRAVSPDRRWAIMLGAEGPGLSVAALDAAAATVRITMSGGVDSLNVATATAVALWHLDAGTHVDVGTP